MSIPDELLAVSARFLRRGFAFACVALLLLGTSTNAGTVLQYGQLNPADMVTATNNGSVINPVTTLSTAGNQDGNFVSIPVVITNLMGTPFPNGFAAFVTYVGVKSVGPAAIDPFTGAVEQLFSGKIEFSQLPGGVGENYLTAVFTSFTLSPVLGGAPHGTSATLAAAQPPDSLVLTTSIPGFALAAPTGMAIGFTNISNTGLHIASNGSIASFTAQDAGGLNASIVPEPGTLGLSSFAIVIGTLTYWKKWKSRSKK